MDHKVHCDVQCHVQSAQWAVPVVCRLHSVRRVDGAVWRRQVSVRREKCATCGAYSAHCSDHTLQRAKAAVCHVQSAQ